MRMHLFIFNSFSLVSSNCVLSAQIYASIVAFLVTNFWSLLLFILLLATPSPHSLFLPINAYKHI